MKVGEKNPAWLVAELDNFFRNQHVAECVMAESRQQQIAAELSRDRKSINGLGSPVMEVDEAIIGHWRERLGYNPMKDSGWRKYMLKHFPECRVKARGTKEIFVGYGSKANHATKRFAKSYG
jgi:hypothetical protein